MLHRIIAVALAALAASAASCGSRYKRPTTSEVCDPTPVRLGRGAYLVNSVAACGACHTTRDSGSIADLPGDTGYLAGGNLIVDSTFNSKVWVPNITPDVATGIGKWTDDEISRAIRDGVSADNRFLSHYMPFVGYHALSDEDAKSIVVYLRTVSPVTQERVPPRNEIAYRGPMGPRGAKRPLPAENVARVPQSDLVKYGRYLAQVAQCTTCHSLSARGYRTESDPLYLAGGGAPYVTEGIGKIWASNLTPDNETGIGRYRAEHIANAIRTGTRLDGTLIGPPMNAFTPSYAGMSDEDINAIVAYLKSLKPVVQAVAPRELTEQGELWLVSRGERPAPAPTRKELIRLKD